MARDRVERGEGRWSKAQAYGEPGRHGPWAKNVSLPVGTLITIRVTGVIGINSIFSCHVSDPFLRVVIDCDRHPDSTQWIPRLHMMQSSVPVSSAVHVKAGSV